MSPALLMDLAELWSPPSVPRYSAADHALPVHFHCIARSSPFEVLDSPTTLLPAGLMFQALAYGSVLYRPKAVYPHELPFQDHTYGLQGEPETAGE